MAVGIAGFRVEVIRLDLDLSNVRNWLDLIQYDYNQDAELKKSENFDVALHIHRKAGDLVLVVVVSGTFDDHFVDNVAIFSAALAADAVIVESIRNLAGVSFRSSYSAEMNRPLAFASDLGDIHSCAADN